LNLVLSWHGLEDHGKPSKSSDGESSLFNSDVPAGVENVIENISYLVRVLRQSSSLICVVVHCEDHKSLAACKGKKEIVAPSQLKRFLPPA